MAAWVDFLPDDWRSAWSAARRLSSVGRQTNHALLKRCIGTGLPFGIGAAAFLLTGSELTQEAIAAVLTFASILAGFAVSALLATVKPDDATDLNLEDARFYVNKVSYLVQSQIITLGVYLLTALASVVALINSQAAFVLVGLFCAAIVRTSLLPYQIYEIQNLALRKMLNAKEQQLKERKAADLRLLRSNGDASR